MKYILLAGPTVFIVVTTILGKLTPNYSQRKNYISELSLGKYGFIQKINFIVNGLLISGLCVFLLINSSTLVTKLGWFLGIFTGIALFLSGIWDTDFGKPERTKAGKRHEFIYNLAIPCVGAAYFLVGWGYKNNLIILILSWAIAIVDFLLYKNSEKLGIEHGISQRVVVFSAVLWIEILAILTLFR
jgi:hypothetical membrane protein